MRLRADYTPIKVVRAPRLKCSCCSEPVYDSEKYIDSGLGILCEHCIDDMTKDELITVLGFEYEVSGYDDD